MQKALYFKNNSTKFASTTGNKDMDFNEIAAVSGKPGLYKVMTSTRTGLVLESLDEKKTKLVTGPHHRVSLLSEISIFTTDIDKTIPLDEIFVKIKKDFDEDPGVDPKSDKEELMAFMKAIAPDFDPDRVYASDIKKILSWYNIIYKEAPELLKEKKEEKKNTSKKKEDKKAEEGSKEDSKD